MNTVVAENLILCTQRGLRSCLRAKVFLSKKKDDFGATVVLSDTAGRQKWLSNGVRNVTVVARGEQFVFGQNLEAVAEFVGIQVSGHTPLSPEQLIVKWVNALRAAQRLVRQMPSE